MLSTTFRLKKVLTALVLANLTLTPHISQAVPRSVNAVLFGYIPDSGHDQYASLKNEIKKRFEAQNPDLQLSLTIDPNVDLYDMTTLSKLLSNDATAAQLVEVDTVMLADMVKQHLVQIVPYTLDDVVTTALPAVTLNNTLYGVPTYLCSNVVYSAAADLEQAKTAQSLISILRKHNPAKVPLIGNYKGSWTLSGFYMDAWADTNSNNPAELPAALQLPLQDSTVHSLSTTVHACAKSGTNPCLDGTYKDNDLAMKDFAEGKANGFVGYTENLYEILSAQPKQSLPLKVISAPMGEGEKPVMYVDALVFNPHCTGECLTDAQTVSKFLSSPTIRNLIAFSQDVGTQAIPRYLMQANKSFYTSEPAASDVYYQTYYRNVVQHAEAVPNEGFPENKDALNKALQQALSTQKQAGHHKRHLKANAH